MATDATTPTMRVARYLGALLLIAAGAVHLQQYFGVFYRVIPVIGPLFLACFAIALLLGIALLMPIERISSWLPRLVAAGGVAFAAGTIVGLEISEFASLFGFHEHGYRFAIVLSIVLEAAAIVVLGAFALAGTHPSRQGSQPTRLDPSMSGAR